MFQHNYMNWIQEDQFFFLAMEKYRKKYAAIVGRKSKASSL